MNNKWILYRHTSPSGKVYIGITSRNKAYKRWKYGHGYKGCKAFYNAILKYGWDNIKHEVLFTNLEEDRAKRLEIELIRHYKALGASYNITNGGDGYLGYTPSNETRAKMRATKIGKPLSESHRRKLSEAQMGRVGTMLGKKHSEETKLKMSMAHKGKKHNMKLPYEERLPIYRKAQKCKTVLQYNKEGIILNIFSSVNEAAKYINTSPSHISECCRGKLKTLKGYIWRFKDD